MASIFVRQLEATLPKAEEDEVDGSNSIGQNYKQGVSQVTEAGSSDGKVYKTGSVSRQ